MYGMRSSATRRRTWRTVRIEYDLSNPKHLRSVYEQVLRAGTADDVRRHIRASTLLEVWDDLFLPDYVRVAWTPWLQSHRPARR